MRKQARSSLLVNIENSFRLFSPKEYRRWSSDCDQSDEDCLPFYIRDFASVMKSTSIEASPEYGTFFFLSLFLSPLLSYFRGVCFLYANGSAMRLLLAKFYRFHYSGGIERSLLSREKGRERKEERHRESPNFPNQSLIFIDSHGGSILKNPGGFS